MACSSAAIADDHHRQHPTSTEDASVQPFLRAVVGFPPDATEHPPRLPRQLGFLPGWPDAGWSHPHCGAVLSRWFCGAGRFGGPTSAAPSCRTAAKTVGHLSPRPVVETVLLTVGELAGLAFEEFVSLLTDELLGRLDGTKVKLASTVAPCGLPVWVEAAGERRRPRSTSRVASAQAEVARSAAGAGRAG